MFVVPEDAKGKTHVDRDRDLDELIVSSSGSTPSTLLKIDPFCFFSLCGSCRFSTHLSNSKYLFKPGQGPDSVTTSNG